MAAKHGLDRKARTAVLLVVLVFLAIILIMAKSCVGMMRPKEVTSQSSPGEHQVVVVGKQTIFLEQGSVGSQIQQWLDSRSTAPRAFAISEQAFEADSDKLTSNGAVRLQRFVYLMKQNPELNARVVVKMYEGGDAAQRQQLASKRAERIRTKMVDQGVANSRITTAAETLAASVTSNGSPPTMVIVLSRKAKSAEGGRKT